MYYTIKISSNYGFDHNWTLVREKTNDDGTTTQVGKSFYLGQDVKFCSRVLGMDTSDLVRRIGTNDLRKESTRRKIARFILKHLDLNARKLSKMEPWALCAQ